MIRIFQPSERKCKQSLPPVTDWMENSDILWQDSTDFVLQEEKVNAVNHRN